MGTKDVPTRTRISCIAILVGTICPHNIGLIRTTHTHIHVYTHIHTQTTADIPKYTCKLDETGKDITFFAVRQDFSIELFLTNAVKCKLTIMSLCFSDNIFELIISAHLIFSHT